MKSMLCVFKKSQEGQALITLLFFMVIGITVITATALVLSAGILSSSTSEQGLIAYYAAESGAENGILHLLRNPSYSGDLPTLSFESGGNASVNISSGVITSIGNYGSSIRKIQITTAESNGAFSITSWREIN